MASSDKKGAHEPPNQVHQQMILTETIKKELHEQKLYSNFTINPYHQIYTVTPKPNSMNDSEYYEMDCDDRMVNRIFSAHQKPPTEKYRYPQTSAQEIGWIHKPLLATDRNDQRMWHAKALTDITIPREAEWKLKEQTKNMN